MAAKTNIQRPATPEKTGKNKADRLSLNGLSNRPTRGRNERKTLATMDIAFPIVECHFLIHGGSYLFYHRLQFLDSGFHRRRHSGLPIWQLPKVF
jgi:hypothetical protein